VSTGEIYSMMRILEENNTAKQRRHDDRLMSLSLSMYKVETRGDSMCYVSLCCLCNVDTNLPNSNKLTCYNASIATVLL